MTRQIFLKVLFIHFFALKLAHASTVNWSLQMTETDKAQALVLPAKVPVVVAVIDTGADIQHPALQNAFWTNSGESGQDSLGRDKATNGIDDDGNGFIDDVHGWNFVTNSGDVSDQHGHGTHISGIIHGAAPMAQMMVLKYYDSHLSNEKNVQNCLRAFQYALQMKARMINFSGGGTGYNPAEEKIMKQAEEKQILVVAAAGNDGVNTDQMKYYPADYPLNNILSVTALNFARRLPLYANFGAHSVHLAAPGDQIRSTLPGGEFGDMSGTSQATALVSGAAALLLSQNPDFISPEAVIQRLVRSGNFETSLVDKTVQASRLNSLHALYMKSPLESAAGFILSSNQIEDSQSFVVSSSSLDP
jgi:subtilisin family serine protease